VQPQSFGCLFHQSNHLTSVTGGSSRFFPKSDLQLEVGHPEISVVQKIRNINIFVTFVYIINKLASKTCSIGAEIQAGTSGEIDGTEV
jgi:hypothetical protein